MSYSGPEFAYIQNVSNGEYLEHHATKMASSYSTPSTLWRIMQNSSGSYFIQNQDNAEYLTSSASQMSSSAGDDQKFNFVPISGSKYYIQNVSNSEYLTSSATKMSKTAGSSEEFTVAEPPIPFND